MLRWSRRLVGVGLLAAAAWLAVRALRRRRAVPRLGSPSEWPPLEPAPRPFVGEPLDHLTDTHPPDTHPVGDADTAADDPAATWVPPEAGECPVSHPIKANASSHIFHVPGGRSYARTIAERCYASPDDAIADGFRPAKA